MFEMTLLSFGRQKRILGHHMGIPTSTLHDPGHCYLENIAVCKIIGFLADLDSCSGGLIHSSGFFSAARLPLNAFINVLILDCLFTCCRQSSGRCRAMSQSLVASIQHR